MVGRYAMISVKQSESGFSFRRVRGRWGGSESVSKSKTAESD